MAASKSTPDGNTSKNNISYKLNCTIKDRTEYFSGNYHTLVTRSDQIDFWLDPVFLDTLLKMHNANHKLNSKNQKKLLPGELEEIKKILVASRLVENE